MTATERPEQPTAKAQRVAFSVVTAGSALGQLFLALSIPFVARLYTSSEVGEFALALSYAQLIAIALSGRLEQSLPRLAPAARWAGFRLALAPTLLLVPLAVAAAWVGGGDVGRFVLGAVPLAASIVVYNILSLCVLSQQLFTLIATMRLVNGLMTAVLQVAGGFVHPTTPMLIATYALGNVCACLLAVPAVVRMVRGRGTDSLRTVWKRERLGRFGVSVGGSALMSNFSLSLPVIAFSALYGNSLVGSFYLARKVLMIPTQLVATTVSDVSYSMIAQLTFAEIRPVVRRWLSGLRKVGLLTVAIGVVAAPVADLVVGDGYDYLWQVVLMLTIASAAQLVATSLSNVLLALHEERLRFLWNVSRLFGLGLLFGLCWALSIPYLWAVGLMSAYLTVNYGSLLRITLRTLDRKAQA